VQVAILTQKKIVRIVHRAVPEADTSSHLTRPVEFVQIIVPSVTAAPSVQAAKMVTISKMTAVMNVRAALVKKTVDCVRAWNGLVMQIHLLVNPVLTTVTAVL